MIIKMKINIQLMKVQKLLFINILYNKVIHM